MTMYPPQTEISEVVQRQRNQKQELSKALVKNKTKLRILQQEIQLLEAPLNPVNGDECGQLDAEIAELRRMCQEMLNEIDKIKRSSDPTAEQRHPLRPAPPPPPHPPPRTRPHTLFPKPQLAPLRSPVSPHSPASQHRQSPSLPNHQLQPQLIDTSDGSNPNNDEPLWQCSMCTLQNHPYLNKCECCDNVRILPGSIRIVPSSPSPPPPAPVGTRSNPQTPGTPASGSSTSSARLLPHSPNDYNRSGVANSSSEANLSEFLGDVFI